MRRIAKVIAIVAAVALVCLIGAIITIAAGAENGLIDAALIPFVVGVLVAITILVIALVILAVLPEGE